MSDFIGDFVGVDTFDRAGVPPEFDASGNFLPPDVIGQGSAPEPTYETEDTISDPHLTDIPPDDEVL